MTDTIRPPNAIAIWASSDYLYAECPGPDGKKSHLLKLDLKPESFTVLINMLKARTPKSTIGSKGDLTKFQIKKELQALAKGFPKEKVKREYVPIVGAEIRASLRDLLRKAGY